MASPFASFNSVVEFKDEEFVKKAVLTMNKHDLSGRPLNIKEVRSIDCRLYLAVLFFFLFIFFILRKADLMLLFSVDCGHMKQS